MNICVFGAGAIGSVFAYQLAKAGHRVTAVARSKRYEQLVADKAIVLDTGERAAVQPADALDVNEPYDLVLVTLFAPQVAPLLPTHRSMVSQKPPLRYGRTVASTHATAERFLPAGPDVRPPTSANQ